MRSISSSRADRNRIGTSEDLADLAADVEPVDLRHADVEHDEVRPVAGEAGQRLLAVARLEHGHAGLPERDADDLADMRVVVDDEDAVRQASLRSVAVNLRPNSAAGSRVRWSRQLRKPQARQEAISLRAVLQGNCGAKQG